MMSLLSSRWLWIAVVVSGLAGVGYQMARSSAGSGSSFSKSTKRFGKVQRGDLTQRVTVSGLVYPLRRTIFVAPYSGYIRKLYVAVGQHIRQGDPVVSVVSNLMSPEQVFPIRAPFGGTVVDVPKSEGEFVTEKDAKDVMVRVDDLSKYFVVSKAPELEAARIRKDMEVDVRISAIKDGGGLKGIVRTVDLAAKEGDGWKQQQATFDVRVEVLNPPSDIRPGQSAVVDITVNKYPDVLYLEQEFINQEGDKYFVITKEGKKKPITIGHQSDLAVEITSGLKEGEEVEQIDFLKLLESGT
jgi:multidrug efflux pump subunit AcrA (membrane-fusion protein)